MAGELSPGGKRYHIAASANMFECEMPSAEKIVELLDVAEAAREPATVSVARFEIRYSQFLDPKGNAVRPLPDLPPTAPS